MCAFSSGSSRVTRPLIPDDAKQNLTEVFINRMLTSAQYLRAAQDYKFWLKRKIQFFIKEGGLLLVFHVFILNINSASFFVHCFGV